MKALKHNGLVRVTVTSPFRGYLTGNTVYLKPEEAQAWIDSGCAEGAKLPKGVEAVTVPPQDPGLISDKILPNPAPEIPENWEGTHMLQRRKLAEQIAGGSVKPDEVDSIIKAEIERRLTE
jgi:hypothetical protein